MSLFKRRKGEEEGPSRGEVLESVDTNQTKRVKGHGSPVTKHEKGLKSNNIVLPVPDHTRPTDRDENH